MTTTAMMMTTTMLAQAAVLNAVCLPTRALGGTGAALGDATPPTGGSREGKGQCPPAPRKHTKEEEAIP